MSKIGAKDSYALSCVRVLACVMIVTCHLFSASAVPVLRAAAQMLNCAIYIFFFISGYLFSTRCIEKPRSWLKNRWLRLAVPEYIYIIIAIIYCSVLTGAFAMPLKGFAVWLFNLQGFVPMGLQEGVTGHLWFLTFIAVCYLVTPLLQKLQSKKSSVKLMLVAALVLLQIGLYLLFKQPCFQFMAGVAVYTGAYFFAEPLLRGLNWKTVLAVGVFAGGAGVLRLVLSKQAEAADGIFAAVYDGAVAVYANVLIAAFLTLAGIWFVRVAYRVLLPLQKPLLFLDKLSYEIYIVHYMFIQGAVSLLHSTRFMPINLLLILTASLLYAILLHWLSSKIMKSIKNLKA